jgi:hypothetical protein
MRRRCVGALCFAVLLSLSPLLIAGGAADIELLVPLYSYPSWYEPTNYVWASVAAAAGQVPVTAVINPNNGPDGGPPNADYRVGLNDLRSADVTILGYVYTSYGARALTAVQADIDLYDQHFNIDGIFVDEASTSTNQLAYYQALYSYIEASPNLRTVISNPGTHQIEPFISTPTADTTVIFEGSDGWLGYAPDDYMTNFPASSFAALVYAEPDAAVMHANIMKAVQRGIGFVYITDDTLPNPWDTLPAYWEDEVNYIQALRELRITALTLSGTDAHIAFTTVTNASFGVERAASLTANEWTTMTNGVQGTGDTVLVVDPEAGARSRQFYRTKLEL